MIFFLPVLHATSNTIIN